MSRAIFVTGNRFKADEVGRLLAGLDVSPRKLALPGLSDAELQGPGLLDLASIAKRKVLAAYALLGTPCFVETTALELDDGTCFTGARFKKELLERGMQDFLSEHGGRRGRTRVAVAFSEDGHPDHVRIFEDAIEGMLLTEPRGSGGFGWDNAWLPDGYQRTLAEMERNKFFLNMRHRPYLELADLLRPASPGGAYEAHLTVSARSEEDLRRFRAFCDAASVKCIFIELGRGAEPFQPMTASYHHGTLRHALEEVRDMARALASDGFDVTRMKLEALGKNRDMPEDDAAALAQPSNYFEFHVKVLLPAHGADLEALQARCASHGAHLSRNARKVREDGASERFVTLRVHGLGKVKADARFDALLEDLAGLGLPLTQRLREYTVYDSNHALDRGWLETST
ncbi:non-canonical purine NTP pyrophosphatase [Myxococcus faecalis]|uniref:non-canonical purine NTP pyrophosphatase n=1 Tax=Myxococcus faecalis TaxID=3115646 RepID=UPI003CFBA28F